MVESNHSQGVEARIRGAVFSTNELNQNQPKALINQPVGQILRLGLGKFSGSTRFSLLLLPLMVFVGVGFFR